MRAIGSTDRTQIDHRWAHVALAAPASCRWTRPHPHEIACGTLATRGLRDGTYSAVHSLPRRGRTGDRRQHRHATTTVVREHHPGVITTTTMVHPHTGRWRLSWRSHTSGTRSSTSGTAAVVSSHVMRACVVKPASFVSSTRPPLRPRRRLLRWRRGGDRGALLIHECSRTPGRRPPAVRDLLPRRVRSVTESARWITARAASRLARWGSPPLVRSRPRRTQPPRPEIRTSARSATRVLCCNLCETC